MPISKAIQTIVEQTEELGCQYDAEVNRQRRTTPRLLDSTAFDTVKNKLTHYALELSMREWSATKRMADNIEEGTQEVFEFDPNEGCNFDCELPVRYGLPCRHWMYTGMVEQCQLPLSLFHPRWRFDGPAVLCSRWIMTWNPEFNEEIGLTLADRHIGDRHGTRGMRRVEESAFAVLDKLRGLPSGMAEPFANAFANGAEKLLSRHEEKLANGKELPLMLPDPIVNEANLRYKKGKKRAMTGLEVAEEKERDASRQRRRNEREASTSTAAESDLEDQEDAENVEVGWADNTQMSYLDPGDKQQEAEPGSQVLPLTIPSDSDSDCIPRRSSRVKKPSKAIESQQWKIANGLIPAPGAKARARTLNAKKKKNMVVSQVANDLDFEIVE